VVDAVHMVLVAGGLVLGRRSCLDVEAVRLLVRRAVMGWRLWGLSSWIGIVGRRW
jgi:hypothetical protein